MGMYGGRLYRVANMQLTMCNLTGDHLGVLPDNTSQLTEQQLAEFGSQLGISNLDEAFDLETLNHTEGHPLPLKPFPLPQTYRCILSGIALTHTHGNQFCRN